MPDRHRGRLAAHPPLSNRLGEAQCGRRPVRPVSLAVIEKDALRRLGRVGVLGKAQLERQAQGLLPGRARGAAEIAVPVDHRRLDIDRRNPAGERARHDAIAHRMTGARMEAEGAVAMSPLPRHLLKPLLKREPVSLQGDDPALRLADPAADRHRSLELGHPGNDPHPQGRRRGCARRNPCRRERQEREEADRPPHGRAYPKAVRRRLTIAVAVAVALVALAMPAVASSGQSQQGSLSWGGAGWSPHMKPAERYAQERAGDVTFAVIDLDGRMHQFHGAGTAPAASVFKVMLLATYLRQDSVRHRPLNSSDRGLLGPMIRRSDNLAATRVRDIVGRDAIERLAHDAHMRDFQYNQVWGLSRTSARDQVRFMYRLRRYIPHRHWKYAKRLLAGIIGPLEPLLQGRLGKRHRPRGPPGRIPSAPPVPHRRGNPHRVRPEPRLRQADAQGSGQAPAARAAAAAPPVLAVPATSTSTRRTGQVGPPAPIDWRRNGLECVIGGHIGHPITQPSSKCFGCIYRLDHTLDECTGASRTASPLLPLLARDSLRSGAWYGVR
ncbi:MAG: serine hydrolase [Actinobacteria bacterium]|nr:MAG: serine hydrolase [Actinomycetota bacterium]